MSKMWIKTSNLKTATAVSLFFLFISPLASETSAKDAAATKTPTYIASHEAIPSDQVEFDGKGTIDAITPFYEANAKDNQDSLVSAMLNINGQQLQCASDVQLYDELSQPLPAQLLLSGDYVGYQIDPSDKIIKLWKVKPQIDTAKMQSGELPVEEKPTAPRNDTALRLVDGVWKN